jgi:DNA-binding NtrC family response regulator
MSIADPLDRKTVLVVDDAGIVRSLFTIALENAGYSVLAVASADDALALAPDVVPAVAIVDIFLGERSGLDLIRSLRASHPLMPIIAVTGGGPAGNFEVLLRAKDLGACLTLVKPVPWRAIVDAVEQALSGQV